MSLETREVYFKRDANYLYKNVSLLHNLIVKKTKTSKKFCLYINGVRVPPTDQTPYEMTWHMPEVRARIRDTYDDNDYIRLNDTLDYNALQAYNHYTSLAFDEFQKTIFTQDLQIQLRPNDVYDSNVPDCIDAKEEVFESDVKKQSKA